MAGVNIEMDLLDILTENLPEVNEKLSVRWEALQALCCAPPSDVLCCESWSSLRRSLSAALADPDPDLSDKVLKFFAKTFSSSPFSVTREIYTSLVKSVESYFHSKKPSFSTGTAGLDVARPDIRRLLKQMRLMNDFQKEVPSFWIRHPEKYMEEVIESTFSLLSFRPDQGTASPDAEKPLEPIHLLALLDIKAIWFKKWMHGSYSRTVIFRLLERKYKDLVTAALRRCLQYNEAATNDAADVPLSPGQHNNCSTQRGVYTWRELEYACLVHSLCIIGKLLIYTNGRRLFPIQVNKDKDPVSLTDLVLTLINIMYQHPHMSSYVDSPHTDSLSPRNLVMEVLWVLCEREDCATDCVCQTPVIDTLLAPVIALLYAQQSKLKSPGATLTHIAETLARIACTDRGLALFLNEKNLLLVNGEGTSASHVIAQFAQRLLDKVPPSLGEAEIPPAVCGAFLLLCRQMYNTCEGLRVLQPYGLHRCIAVAWKKTCSTSESVPTPVPGDSTGKSSLEMQRLAIWEETLLDSLLHFAATPKGLLLLQQTGAFNDCVSYMFSRFTKKLKVSRSEKFGYGMMVTQVAATAPGAVALLHSGYVQALVVELWSALECSREDLRAARPKSTPMDPIDRSCLKSFLSLVNLLSSPQSLWELLGSQPLPNKADYSLREIPTTLVDLIDRLITVDLDVKIHSLFNYEQSHTFGLRLLSVLCCNLDSFLLLESQYSICSILLQCQRDNVTEPASGQGEFIIDGLSVERNHVLVRVGAVGGPSERRLPPRALHEGANPYPWPMFSSYPLPQCYTLEIPNVNHSTQDSEISAFLSSSKNTEKEMGWMEICRRQYCKTLTTQPNVLTGTVLADLLEEVLSCLFNHATERFFPPIQYKAEEETVNTITLSSVQQLGVDTCFRYGRYLGVIHEDSMQNLTLLLKHTELSLSTQRATISTELSSLGAGHPGHDWLSSTAFLIMAGNADRTLRLLLQLSSLLTSAFIWPARMHASVHIPAEVARSGIPPVYWCTAHYVEMLLRAELPLVHSAFRMSGFTASQMCLQWLGQCFWNYLDWSEICHYVSTCVVMGSDYQVYMCVAVLKHLQPDILQHTQAQELQLHLKEEPLRGFRVSNYLEFMQELERKYRMIVLTDMKNITNPVA